ncbi:DUF1153 domain-containing protein [Algicella marina]|uniref:DUF1153 domain-containing protein n=1 Tax=Algicella marina TaxID=2683284 RepID=A0A6P1SZ61_9RHOB|nr:DUF1153 domain-containing protein [Algicella marina]QHQ34506.1 DUF1153 domain-containing protein [Algicella marina]
MYIRREKGPVFVTMPDGTRMSRADLPDIGTTRWVARRKAAVVNAVNAGLIQEEEACDMYGLSAEELHSWRVALQTHGSRALKATSLQKYRQL